MNDEIKEILDTPIFIIDDEGFTVYINDKINKYITNLQQENERLKVKTKEQSLLLIDYQDMEQRYNDYKSRCEKAIEYIENPRHEMSVLTYQNLLNILQNGSEEK